jgi:lysophospholipase D
MLLLAYIQAFGIIFAVFIFYYLFLASPIIIVQYMLSIGTVEALSIGVAVYTLYNLCWYYPVFVKKTKNYGERRSNASSIAHRGSRKEGLPENTIAAYSDAVEGGASVVELDVWLTSDNEVVVHHDDTLERMSGGSHSHHINDISSDKLPNIVPSAGQSERVQDFHPHHCLTIPLFRDVLDALPKQTVIIIEFKQDSLFLISEVLRILELTGRKNDVFWFSLDEKLNKKLRAADSSIPTINSIQGMLKTLVYYYLGILPFVELEDAVFGITLEKVRKH